MSQESLQALDSATPAIPAIPVGVLPAAAPALPLARSLRESLTRSQHPHLGYFESPTDTLIQALDQQVQRGARLLARDSLILVVECGLGGAVHQLAALGHRAVGIDRDATSVNLARARATSPRARFLNASLEQFAERARGARLDALCLHEALAGQSDLRALLVQTRGLLRPGGLLLINEVVRHPAVLPTPTGRHALGAVRAAADASGFDLVESRDLSNRTAPTLSRLLRVLTERKDELTRRFATTAERSAELAAEERRLRVDELAFTRQELFYESTVLRLGARFAHDSVVLRTKRTS